MLSRYCDGCEMMHMRIERYRRERKDEKVCCQDETAHLVDQKIAPHAFSRLLF